MVSPARHEAVGIPAPVPSSFGTFPDTRAILSGLVAVLPALGVGAADLAARSDQIASWSLDALRRYVLTWFLGGVLWGALVTAAGSRRSWAAWALLVVGAAFSLGGQFYFFARYHAYLNPRAVLVGTSMLPSVGQQLWSDRTSFVLALLPPVAFAILLPAALRGIAPVPQARRRRALDIAVAALLLSTFGVNVPAKGQQIASPDILYFASLGQLTLAHWRHDDTIARARPGPRTPAAVPHMSPRGDRHSVLFIVTESVRAIDACSASTSDCSTTPFTNALLPNRFGFSQMRALDSTTAVSLAVLWGGQPAAASREALHTAPLLWEFAHAADFDTAYWTSQNMLFANAGTWLDGIPLSRWISATDLDPDPSYELGADDGKLVDVAIHDIKAMHAPFVGVVHLSNTHFPYLIDENDAPFQPQAQAFGAGDASKVRNRYRDAIRRQDAIVARLVKATRAMPESAGVVIAFISDHGEQIRERGAIGHTWGVYDEEVRVPFWIDIPNGILTPGEQETLRNLTSTPLTQLDVLPTLLDLMGLWDRPEVAAFRRKMPGESLLRGGTPGRAVILTNCSPIFACAFRNWGAMRGSMKLVATQNQVHWECFDVAHDPDERRDLGTATCGDLEAIAEGDGRGTPF